MAAPLPLPHETRDERAARVQHLKDLVAAGRYHVDLRRLAVAMLWTPRKAQHHLVSERRRHYMREYMRKRRELQAALKEAKARSR